MARPVVGDVVWHVMPILNAPMILGPLYVVSISKNSVVKLRDDICGDEFCVKGWRRLHSNYETARAVFVDEVNRALDKLLQRKKEAQSLSEEDFIGLQIQRQERRRQTEALNCD